MIELDQQAVLCGPSEANEVSNALVEREGAKASLNWSRLSQESNYFYPQTVV